jgi:hypothetical protein
MAFRSFAIAERRAPRCLGRKQPNVRDTSARPTNRCEYYVNWSFCFQSDLSRGSSDLPRGSSDRILLADASRCSPSPAVVCGPAAVWDGLLLQLTEMSFVSCLLLCFGHWLLLIRSSECSLDALQGSTRETVTTMRCMRTPRPGITLAT